MNDFIRNLVEPVTGKSNLGDISFQDLQKLVQQFPYFGPGHFLLQQKAKRESLRPDQAANHTDSLFFHHIAWHRFVSTPGINFSEDKFENNEILTEPNEEVVEPLIHSDETVTPVETEIEESNQPNSEQFDEEDEDFDDKTDDVTEEEIKIPSLTIEPIDPATAELTYTPYHTVDYFASQGIKIKEETPQTKQFDTRLRSFTDWLKTMKKLPATEKDVTISRDDEQKVTKMAGESIVEGDVDTEAMAEVWIKQGEPIKAREIYRKLSLRNPAKSAYFAAKIENLK